MAKQVWRLPFRKEGHPAETIDISTKGKIVGDYISLPRKYFRIDGTSVSFLDKKDNQHKAAILKKDDSGPLIAAGLDEELTNSLNIPVYTKLQLNSIKVANTILRVTYQPFGDILDPDDFGQCLTPDSDVKHKNLTLTEDLNSRDITALDKITGNKILTNTGNIKNLSTDELKTKELDIGAEENKFTFENGMLKIKGKTYPQVNINNLTYENTLTVLTFSPANYSEITSVPFLKIDIKNKDLIIQDINIFKEINNLKKEIENLKKEKTEIIQIQELKEGK